LVKRKPRLVDDKVARRLARLFPEPASTLPRKLGKLRVFGARTITRFGDWHKAMVIVDNGQTIQLRFYGWRKNSQGEWKQRQNFNLTGSKILELMELLQEIYLTFPEGLPSVRSGKKTLE
jgi:hypothetical protein